MQIYEFVTNADNARKWVLGLTRWGDASCRPHQQQYFCFYKQSCDVFKCRGGVIDEFVHSPTKAANSFVNVIVPAILSRCCVHFGFL